MHPRKVTSSQDTHEPASQPVAHTKQHWSVSDQTNVHAFGLLEEIRKKKITDTRTAGRLGTERPKSNPEPFG